MDHWTIACRIYGDYLLERIIGEPVPGVRYLAPERYVEIVVEKLYFSRQIMYDEPVREDAP